MKSILLAVLLGSTLLAQAPQSSGPVFEMTVTNAIAIGFDAPTLATLNVRGGGDARCSGVLDGGAIRFRVDVDADMVTAALGTPLADERAIVIIGLVNITRFQAIAEAADGVIFWTCFN